MKTPTYWLRLLALVLLPSLVTAFPGEFKWKFPVKGALESGPAISKSGILYAGTTKNYLYAVDSKNGSERWQQLFLHPIQPSPLLSADGSIVYLTSYTSKCSGYKITVTAAEGTPALNRKLYDQFFNNSRQKIILNAETDTIYTYRTEANSDSRKDYAVYRLGVAPVNNPRVTDTYIARLGKFRTDWPSLASWEPALIGKNGIISQFSLGNTNYFLMATNFIKPIDAFFPYHTVASWRSKPVVTPISSPAVDSTHHLVYTGGKDGTLYAYNELSFRRLRIGTPIIKPLWTFKVANTDLSLNAPTAAENGVVYLSSTEGLLYAVISAPDVPGQLLFKLPISTHGLGLRPTLDRNNQLLYLVDNSGGLFAVDLSSKNPSKPKILWHAAKARAVALPVISPVDGAVVVSSVNTDKTTYSLKAYAGGRN